MVCCGTMERVTLEPSQHIFLASGRLTSGSGVTTIIRYRSSGRFGTCLAGKQV